MANAVKQSQVAHRQHILEEKRDIPILMGFTRNKNHIAQYKELREWLYKSDPRFVGFRIFTENEAENYEDPDDQMLIIHDGERCYGGACLRISTPQHPVRLDLENDIMPLPEEKKFSLVKRFPEMELNKYGYSEFNRIVIDPSLRQGEATKEVFLHIMERCREYKVRFMFGTGDKARIRLYRQIYTNAGMECRIREDLDIPVRQEYEGVKMYLLAGDMKKFYISPDDPEATCLLSPRSDFKF